MGSVGRPYPLTDKLLDSKIEDSVPWEEWLLRDIDGIDIDEEAENLFRKCAW